ncbi:MAG: hypothetical protein N2654_01940, partial [Deltaproteobacteria bacterium]|nr:hypothetical protein [Deltaproteobacteria bacterium]
MKPVKAAVSLRNFKRKLKVGDPVAVISGPLSNRPLEERVGKILNFEVRKGKLLVRVGGINVRRKLIRARRPGEENRFVETEFPIAYS